MIKLKILNYLLQDNRKISEVNKILKPEYFNEYSDIYSFIIEKFESSDRVTEVDLVIKFNTEIVKKIKAEELDLYGNKFNELVLAFFDTSQLEILNKLIAKTDKLNIDEKLETFQNCINHIEDNYISIRTREKSFGENLEDIYKDIEKRKADHTKAGLQITNLPSINRMIGGIMPNDLFAIYGQEKSAKTTLATSIALNLSLDQNHTGAIFSLEVSKEQMLWKAISMKSGLDFLKIRDPYGTKLSESELSDSAKRMSQYLNKKLYVFDHIDTETGIRSKIKELKKEGLKFAVIDYLMLISSTITRQNMREELNYLTRFFKMKVCKELGVPVILISQANESGQRAAEGKGLERDSDYFFYIRKGNGETMVDYTTVDGKKFSDYRLGENEYIAKARGIRHSKGGDSAILIFNNNDFVEKELVHFNEELCF